MLKTKEKMPVLQQGDCTLGSDCVFEHPQGDCKQYLAGDDCRDRKCKLWDSKDGYFRGEYYQYSYERMLRK